MKRKRIRPFPYILPLLVTVMAFSSLHAQTASSSLPPRYGIDLDFGVAIPAGKDFKSIFYTGGNISMGFKFAALPTKTLWIKPVCDLSFYSKKADDVGSGVMERFDVVKAGLELQYKAATMNKFSLYPVLKGSYGWASNYFSKTGSTEQIGTVTVQQISESDRYLKGGGMAYDAGLMLTRSFWYLRADYSYFKPKLKVHPDIIKEMTDVGVNIANNYSPDCSTFNISFGVNFNFR